MPIDSRLVACKLKDAFACLHPALAKNGVSMTIIFHNLRLSLLMSLQEKV